LRPPTTRRFRLTERQTLANKLLAGPQKHTLLRGGSRSGKTFVLVRAIVLRACAAQAPGTPSCAFAATPPALRSGSTPFPR